MKLIKIFIFLVSIILMTACESEVVNVRLPEYRQKLVVTAFLSPSDTVSYVHIGMTAPLFSGNNDFIMPGKISASISDGAREVELDSVGLKNSMPGTFRLDPLKMKIEYGKRYSIRVMTASGYSAEAFCNVPEKKSPVITIDTVRILEKSGYAGLRARASFKDFPGEEDYYRVKFMIRVHSTDPHSGPRVYENNMRVEKKFISDDKIDGNEITVVPEDYLYMSGTRDSVFLVFRLLHTEKSYFLYHQSLDNYRGDDIPFVEPTLVYSNVNGGLGVFTSYTVDSAVFRLQ